MAGFGSITTNTGGWEAGTITVVCGAVAGNTRGSMSGAVTSVTVVQPAPARITTSNAVLKRLPLQPVHEIAQRRPGVELCALREALSLVCWLLRTCGVFLENDDVLPHLNFGQVSLEFEIIDASVSDAAPRGHT